MDENILKEMVSGIVSICQGRVREIILYGSVARQTDTDESDVDIAVLMYGPLSLEEDDALSELIADMNLKYDKVFSVIDIDCEHFDKWINVMPFYQNVEKEGISLWKAA